MAWIIPSWKRLRDLGRASICEQVSRPKIGTGVVFWVIAGLLTIGTPAYAVRICGSSKANVNDVHCGGASANSGANSCGAGQYCCNETNPATCGDTRSISCNTQSDICQMPAAVSLCTDVADPTCTVQNAPIYGCQSGSYCCTNGNSAPSCNPNIVGLQIYTSNCNPEVNICLAGTPTPTPTPSSTPSTTPSSTPSPTVSPTASATPTATPKPPPLACNGNRREIAVKNQASIPIWVSGGGGALRATCTINSHTQCLPSVYTSAAGLNCNCDGSGTYNGVLTCPGTSEPSNGGLNCSATGSETCGAFAQPNPNNNRCYYILPQPSKLKGLTNNNPAKWHWELTPGAEADFCLAPSTVTYSGASGLKIIPSAVWWSGGVFARTGCLTGKKTRGIECATADCSAAAGSNCPAGVGGNNPATIAEFTLQRQATDLYDVTVINGMNIAEEMQPLPQPTQTPGAVPTDYWCQAPGAATSTISGKDCSWNPAPYIAAVPLATPTDETALLINTTEYCSPTGLNGLPECPFGYTCSGNYGTCYETCTSDSQCVGAGGHCVAGGNGTSYCQCQAGSDCAQNSAGPYCGSQLAVGIAGGNGGALYLQQCGPFKGWWSADDLCANSSTVFGPLNCGAAIVDGDGNNTNLPSLFGCNGAGGGNGANETSCYNSAAATNGCCGCGTSNANTLVGDWPDDATGECASNNTTWAAQIQPWLANLKQSCPTAYSYPFDDFTSTFQCQGSGSVNLLGYEVKFSDLPVPPTAAPTPP